MKRVLTFTLILIAACVSSIPLWRAVEQHAEGLAAKLPSHSPGGRGKHENSAHLTPDQEWLAHLRALLRAGDLGAVQEELNRMAEAQPFLALEGIRRLANLDGQLDLATPAGQAGRRLPWGDPRSVEALNLVGIRRYDSKPSAWGQYLAAQAGLHPPEEIYAEAQKAKCSHDDLQEIYVDWAHGEARRDPMGFTALLAGPGSRDLGLWREFFGGLEEQPDLYASVLDRIPPERRSFEPLAAALGAWLYASPKLETLIQASRFLPMTDISCMADLEASYSDPDQREAFMTFFIQKQPYEQHEMLGNMNFGNSGDMAELLPVLKLCPSLDSEITVVREWFNASDLESPARSGDSWIDQLPSEKLRAETKKMLGR